MAYPSEGVHQQSLLDYANWRMDREMDQEDKGSRTEDVDLTHSTYELTRDLGPSAFRDKISVLNITDVPLAVLVLPLSYGDETLGAISARLATSEPMQIRWAMEEAARRGSAAVYSLDRRNDLVLYDGLNLTVSEVLLVIANVREDVLSVFDARRVSATENLVLAVLPGLLLEGSGIVPIQPWRLAETMVEEILDRMVEIPRELECDAIAQPPIKVQFTIADGDLAFRLVSLDSKLGDTMGSIRDRLGAYGVEDEQDMYICHNGKLPGDDFVLSDLEFWEYRGLSGGQDRLVLSMYLLPGRAQGRLSHILESGREFDSALNSSEIEVLFTRNERVVHCLKTHQLSSLRHLKIDAIRHVITLPPERYGRPLKEHSEFSLNLSSGPLKDEHYPLDFISQELLEQESVISLNITVDEATLGYAHSPGFTIPPALSLSASRKSTPVYGLAACWGSTTSSESRQWPWQRLRLPLEERDFDGKEVNDFDVRTFKKYSSKVVFVNRTSRRVHISCFPTWSKDVRVTRAGFDVAIGAVEVGANGEIGTTLRYFQGYGAVDDPCLAPFGAYETVNIANGMVREMSVVFGVESEDGDFIEYKRLKNVKGGQQVDVLKAFIDKIPKYTHPARQPSKSALAAHFLPNI